MGVLNLPQLGANAGDRNPEAAAAVVSPLLQLLFKNIKEKQDTKTATSQLEQAALDAEGSLPVNKGKSPLMELIQKPQGYDEIPETIQRPVEELPTTSAPNPSWTRIPRTKDAVEKASELTLKQMLEGPDKDKKLTIPEDMRKFLVVNQNLHGNDMTTPQGEAGGMRYIGTPEGSKAYEEWVKKTRAELYPSYSFQWGPQGLVAFDRRNPTSPGVNLNTPKPLSTEQQDKLSLLTELKNKALMLKKGAKPEYFGPIDKPLGSITRVLGMNDPEQDRFIANANDMKEYLFSQGGKALTATELAQITPSLPDPIRRSYMTDLDTFLAKLENRINSINQVAGQTGTTTYNPTGQGPVSSEPDMIYKGGQYIPNPNKRR